MPFLRLDDRFTEHRKIIALRRADRWTWLEVLAYCARHGNGHVPANIVDVLRHVTPTMVARCVDVGLLDPNPDGSFEVHDWTIYNARTLEDRVRGALESDPNITATEVWRNVGGRKAEVLKIVATVNAERGHKPNHGSGGTAHGSQAGSQGTGLAVPRARDAHARGPDQDQDLEHHQQGVTRETAPDDDGNEQTRAALSRLTLAGWSRSQVADAAGEHGDLDRAIAWLDHAEQTPGTRNPGGLAWSGYSSNAWPPEARLEVAPGANGTRSTIEVHEHVCPTCGPSISYKTEARLVEHLENVHGIDNRGQPTEYVRLTDEPEIDVT